MKNKKSLLFIAALILFIVVAFSTFGRINQNKKSELIITLKDYLIGSFVAELPEINKNLPHKIDNNTSLLSISYDAERVFSRYEIVSVADFGWQINTNKNKVKDFLIKQVCDQEIKKKLIEVDIIFFEEYQNIKGEKLFDFSVGKKECAESEKQKSPQ